MATSGNLYIVIKWGDTYLMGTESDDYQVWDLTLGNLQPVSPGNTLQSSEFLSIINDIASGPLGLSDTSLEIYLAYDSVAAPGDLFYTGQPLRFSVQEQIAFPGCMGWGCTASGGRGGKILYVSNLNDSGQGSLREALTTPGPRTVLFKVAGLIELESPIEVGGERNIAMLRACQINGKTNMDLTQVMPWREMQTRMAMAIPM